MNSLIFDAHLDLSMNAMEWNRDIRLPLVELRRRELGMTDKPDDECCYLPAKKPWVAPLAT
jgi:membrane dipeptidase